MRNLRLSVAHRFWTLTGSQRSAGGRTLARPPGHNATLGSAPTGSQSAVLCDPVGVDLSSLANRWSSWRSTTANLYDPFGVDLSIARATSGRAGARPPANLYDPFGVDLSIDRATGGRAGARPPANLCDPFGVRNCLRRQSSVVDAAEVVVDADIPGHQLHLVDLRQRAGRADRVAVDRPDVHDFRLVGRRAVQERDGIVAGHQAVETVITVVVGRGGQVDGSAVGVRPGQL